MRYFKLYEQWLEDISQNPIYAGIKPGEILELDKDKRDLLLQLDKEYGDLYKQFWSKWRTIRCVNCNKTEYDKFIKALDQGERYYPYIELADDRLDENFLVDAESLKKKFQGFNCYLSQFYISNINFMTIQAKVTIYKDNTQIRQEYNNVFCPQISEKNYLAAWDMINKHPYEDVREKQPHTAEDIIKRMQDHIDKLGYKYNVVLDPYMVARQNVNPHQPQLNIKKDAKFSDIDVMSLQIHEVEVHVARRHYGADTGLNLFLDGLVGRNTTDEGMAIYASLHENPKGVRPNLEWDIAIKVIIGYHIMEMDFCDLFIWLLDKVKTEENKGNVGFVLFEDLLRFKRSIRNTKYLGGDAMNETDYFVGYMMVKDMSESEKDDLIRWNVGPDQIKDIPDIKKFFKHNKFKPLYDDKSKPHKDK
jgi:hypothetical protein